ncbi:hypothetical protein HY493_00760 [Candidatus Woesearchaeota archaeon]|nr:hypothetical protein [Candidatus Woesearchaeota archaeon]
MMRRAVLFTLVLSLFALPALASLDGDVENQGLTVRFATADDAVVRVGYELPSTDRNEMYATAFVVMAMMFKNHPTTPTYEVYQYAGDVLVQKLTVKNTDVYDMLFGSMTNAQFWNKVQVELFPGPPSGGGFLAVLGTVFLVGFLVFIGVVGLVIFLIVKAQKSKKGK